MKTKRIVLDALLAALALSLFLVEAQIPSPVPVPGVRLGLANLVTVAALFLLSPADAAAILFVRVLLGAVFGGNMMALLYSAVGGTLCFFAMWALRRVIREGQIWACSAVGAIAHNCGQMIVAVAVTRTPTLAVYLPVLLVSGILAGIFTGLVAQFLVRRMGPVLEKRGLRTYPKRKE